MTESDQSQVVLKGEIHTSESDLTERSASFLVEGVDALVLEGEREDADYGLLRAGTRLLCRLLGSSSLIRSILIIAFWST